MTAACFINLSCNFVEIIPLSFHTDNEIDTIYDMIWYDVIWYMIWYDTRYDLIYDMICYMIWYDRVWYDMIWYDMIWYDMIWYDSIGYDVIYLLTAIGLIPSGSSTVHIYTQTINRTTQLTTLVGRLSWIRTQIGQTNWEECGPCPIFASCTLSLALQLKKKHGNTSVRELVTFINCVFSTFHYCMLS